VVTRIQEGATAMGSSMRVFTGGGEENEDGLDLVALKWTAR
jgi:hypothetical protein